MTLISSSTCARRRSRCRRSRWFATPYRRRSWRSPAPRTRRAPSSSSPCGLLLGRAGAETDDLECGAEHGSRLRHNCSGKHAGFLFLCRSRGWETEGYRLPDHPLQVELLGLVAETVGRPAGEIATATDGCGVPTFALSLTELARMFAGFAKGSPRGMDTVVAAMTAHPELVGGPTGCGHAGHARAPRLRRQARGRGRPLRRASGRKRHGPKGRGRGYRASYAVAGAVLGIAELAERPVHTSRGDVVGTVSAAL